MTADATQAWSQYWDAAPDAKALTGAAASAPIQSFWSRVLGAAVADAPGGRMLDAAAGEGVIAVRLREVERARRAAPMFVICADISHSACHAVLKSRAPSTSAVVADSAQPPFAEGAFDLVVSQFGLEYAGPQAFMEAAALVGAPGRLAFVAHVADGAIERECRLNFTCLEHLERVGLIALVRERFTEAGARAQPDQARTALEAACASLADACEGVQAPAAEFVLRLVSDCARLWLNAQAYRTADALAWLDHQQAAAGAYAGRMSTMIGAAQPEGAMRGLTEALGAAGFSAVTLDQLSAAPGQPAAAWALEAVRG